MTAILRTLLDHPEFREGRDWYRERLPPGRAVFEEGTRGREVYLVLAGAVRVVGDVELDEERRIHPGICDLTEGAIFGELALFDEQPRSARVETLRETELAVLEGEALLRFFDRHPEVGYGFLKELLGVVVSRLRQTNKKLASLLVWGLRVHQIDTHL